MGTIAAEEAVKVPPVDVGRVNAAGSLPAIRGFVSRDAMEVNKGPLGPKVYSASRRGGREGGTCGEVFVVPFVDCERRVCWICFVSVEGLLRRRF
jgi:hypothetical protein